MGAIKLQPASDDRYLSKDPIGFAGHDVNLYRYVFNNPLRYTDPSGLDIFFFSFGGSAAGGGGVGSGNAGSFGVGFGLDTSTWTFFKFTESGSGTDASGAYAGGGVTGGYFPGALEQFLGPGTESSMSIGLGMAGGGVSVIESGGSQGFTISFRGPGVGAAAACTQTQSNQF